MGSHPKTTHERAVERQQARRQEAAASHQQLSELAEKRTGLRTAERVAAAASKRAMPYGPQQHP